MSTLSGASDALYPTQTGLPDAGSVMSQPVATVDCGESVESAARIMAERDVSSLLVLEAEKPVGILTDRDLRRRVVAQGRDRSTAVAEVMTGDLVSIGRETSVLDAMRLMLDRHINHLPVVEQGRAVGMLSRSDLPPTTLAVPVLWVNRVLRADSQDALVELCEAGRAALIALEEERFSPILIAEGLSALYDACTRRLIELTERTLGPSPVPWCWLALGSLARREVLPGADQDNGIVIADSTGAADMAWFEALAEQVCAGLDRCGYPLCRGGVMATRTQWRRTLSEWLADVEAWVATPSAEALVSAAIAFDLRRVVGDVDLFDELQQGMLDRVAGQGIFLGTLAGNALQTAAPLGMLRRFLVDRGREHPGEIDLKARGTQPVVDLVRLHALAQGETAVPTLARLERIKRGNTISEGLARDLGDAFAVLLGLRFSVAAERYRAGRPVHGYLAPEELGRLPREQLRDALSVVQEAQEALQRNFRPGI